MFKNLFVKKKKIFFILLVTIIIGLFFFNNLISERFPNLYLTKFLLKKKSKIENLNNDYNVKFLPDTQFLKLNYEKKKIEI